MRAVVSQPTAPIAQNNTGRLPRSKSVVRMITMNRYGSEYRTSTNRIISSSVRPPMKPAVAPHVTPITRLIAVDTKLITSEMRTPLKVRTSRSRPNLSVPSQCEPESNGLVARCCQSSESAAYGLASGPTSAATASNRMTPAAAIATRLCSKRAATLLHALRVRRKSDTEVDSDETLLMPHARGEPPVDEVSNQIKKEY